MEGQFTDFFSGKKVDTSIGYIGTDLINPTKNCAIIVPYWNGWQDWLCKVPPAQPISCSCEHPGQMYLQLGAFAQILQLIISMCQGIKRGLVLSFSKASIPPPLNMTLKIWYGNL